MRVSTTKRQAVSFTKAPRRPGMQIDRGVVLASEQAKAGMTPEAQAGPSEGEIEWRGPSAGDAAEDRVGCLGTQWTSGVRAHPERADRWSGRDGGRDNAIAVDAGQRLVGQRPAERVRRSPLTAARSGTSNPMLQIVSALVRTEPSASTTESARTSSTDSSSRS
jgi:hypothetical protein